MTDEEIREAARAVFVDQGPAAPVASIARRLGVTSPALFHRVGTKEELLRIALGSGKPDGIERLVAEPPDEGARQELLSILGELMVFFQRVVPNLLVLKAARVSAAQTSSSPLGGPPPVVLRRLLASWLARASARGSLGALDPTALAEGLLGAMEARCFNAYLGGSDYAPGDDTSFLSSLVHGLAPPPLLHPTKRKRTR